MKLKEKFYRCENCGAEICFSSTSNVSSCIYCNSSVVYIDKDIANLNVKKIIPFEISIDEVQNNLDYYLKSSSKKFFKPKSIKQLYVPVCFGKFDVHYSVKSEYLVNGTTYNSEDLLIGNVRNEFFPLFKRSDNFLFSMKDIQEKEKLDFSPILLEGIPFEYDENIVIREQVNNFAIKLCEKEFLKVRENQRILKENCSISNLNLESFSTLIPVYVVFFQDNTFLYISGIKPHKKESNAIFFVLELLAIIAIFIIIKFINRLNIVLLLFFAFFLLFFQILILIVGMVKPKKKIVSDNEHFSYKIVNVESNQVGLKKI